MKRIGLGIAIILAGILLQLSLGEPLYYISWIIGIIGLAFAIAGFIEKEE